MPVYATPMAAHERRLGKFGGPTLIDGPVVSPRVGLPASGNSYPVHESA